MSIFLNRCRSDLPNGTRSQNLNWLKNKWCCGSVRSHSDSWRNMILSNRNYSAKFTRNAHWPTWSELHINRNELSGVIKHKLTNLLICMPLQNTRQQAAVHFQGFPVSSNDITMASLSHLWSLTRPFWFRYTKDHLFWRRVITASFFVRIHWREIIL